MAISILLVPFGLTEVVTFALSVAAIVITAVVLIQGYRDTAAIHAKLDEIVVALQETRNDVVGLEHNDPEEIRQVIAKLESEAELLSGKTNNSVGRDDSAVRVRRQHRKPSGTRTSS